MNGVLTLNNLSSLDFPLERISISGSEESLKALEQAEELEEKFLLLKKGIGDKLFNQLSYDDKILMADTAGVLDFGHPIDLDKIEEEIENYDYSR